LFLQEPFFLSLLGCVEVIYNHRIPQINKEAIYQHLYCRDTGLHVVRT